MCSCLQRRRALQPIRFLCIPTLLQFRLPSSSKLLRHIQKTFLPDYHHQIRNARISKAKARGSCGPSASCTFCHVMTTNFPSRADFQKTYSKTKVPFSWPSSIPTIIPHRIRRKLRSKVRSRQSPSSSLAALQTSWSPADTLQSLREHRWSYYDGQYLLLLILAIFSLCMISSPGPLIKTAVSTLFLTALILPITRQFFLPFAPIAGWLVFFYACG